MSPFSDFIFLKKAISHLKTCILNKLLNNLRKGWYVGLLIV